MEEMKVVDFRKLETSRLILVVEDVYETRTGIEALLKANGYRVALAQGEGEPINSTRPDRPDLILVSVASLPSDVLIKAGRMRKEAAVGDEVPVVVFCAQDIGEGEELAIERNVYLTNPDNFNQLRTLLARLLLEASHVHVTNGERPNGIYDK
jgi:CheY-like chemotaxis protein